MKSSAGRYVTFSHATIGLISFINNDNNVLSIPGTFNIFLFVLPVVLFPSFLCMCLISLTGKLKKKLCRTKVYFPNTSLCVFFGYHLFMSFFKLFYLQSNFFIPRLQTAVA